MAGVVARAGSGKDLAGLGPAPSGTCPVAPLKHGCRVLLMIVEKADKHLSAIDRSGGDR